jgi:transcriptional regulator with XRE-family HTH domain
MSEFLTQEQLGERLAAMRAEQGISRQRIASLIGVEVVDVERIEGGARGLAVDELVALAGLFGTEPAALLRAEPDVRPLFRNDGDEAEADEALRAVEEIIDDVFTFEAAVRI